MESYEKSETEVLVQVFFGSRVSQIMILIPFICKKQNKRKQKTYKTYTTLSDTDSH